MNGSPMPEGLAACPSCNAALPKMPQRKTKCRVCGQFIYVKGTPENRTKRLMTEVETKQAEVLWAAYAAEQIIDEMGIRRGFTREQWRESIAKQGGMYPPNLQPHAPPERHLSNPLFAEQYQSLEAYLRNLLRDEQWASEHLPDRAPRHYRIEKRKPFDVDRQMRRLFDAGVSIPDIARRVGFSVQTVADALATGGIHWRIGPQCDQWGGRQFRLSEALAEMPIPCGPGCSCDWTAVEPWGTKKSSPTNEVGVSAPSEIAHLTAEQIEQARVAWSRVLGIDLPKAGE